MRGLIGHTGFVGSNILQAKGDFDALFNSSNFEDLKGQHFSTLICAGVYAVKWQANKNPEQDKARIDALQDVLKTVTADQFCLVSTVDVYPSPYDVDENTDLVGVKNHAYGLHRLSFENFCRRNFQRTNIIRLPGLFGHGLKKNVIYDLLNDNCLDVINPASSFQYYNLKRLARDIDLISRSNIDLVNLVTEPIKTSDIIARFFADKAVGLNVSPELHYDIKTINGGVFDSETCYVQSADEVMRELGEFISGYKKAELCV